MKPMKIVHPRLRPVRHLRAWAAIVALCLATGLFATDGFAKRQPREVRQPDLKILSVALTPAPYAPAAGPMEIAVEVELPQALQGDTLLEVTSLITSPSKRSLRFLADRQPIKQIVTPVPSGAATNSDAKPRANLHLSWDGKDQTKQMVQTGRYDYEIRAKLLEVSDKGPRTQMVAWPKRGVLEVK